MRRATMTYLLWTLVWLTPLGCDEPTGEAPSEDGSVVIAVEASALSVDDIAKVEVTPMGIGTSPIVRPDPKKCISPSICVPTWLEVFIIWPLAPCPICAPAMRLKYWTCRGI